MTIRNRVKELRHVKASELRANPRNWRKHPEPQRRYLRAMIEELGFADALLAREVNGHLELIDGHLRQDLAREMEVPVLVLDLTEDEANKLLATLDPLSAMAQADTERFKELTALIETDNLRMKSLLNTIDQTQKGGKGFRPGGGFAWEKVATWTEAADFFSIPPDVAEALSTRKIKIVQFSGGKDSLAVLLWVCRNYPDEEKYAVFSDTGVEFPGITAHVISSAKLLGAEPIIVHPPLDWWGWLEEKGEWPSLIYRPCMTEFIHKPVNAWIRKKDKPENIAIFTGSRAEETSRGSQKTATSSLPTMGKDASKWFHYAPCFSVTKSVIGEILNSSKTPLWEGYEAGFVRTACWCCPGQCGAQARALATNYPGLANCIRRWEKKIGIMQPLAANCFDDLLRASDRKHADAAGAQQAAEGSTVAVASGGAAQ